MPFNKVNLDAEISAKLQSISTLYSSLEATLSGQGDCREKFLAITNLEQSFMWLVRMCEREQMEKVLNSQVVYKQPQQQTQQPLYNPAAPVKPMSPNATILAESRIKLDSLMSSIKELTDTVAITGLPNLNQ
jgi:hypothetical protein